MILNSLHRSDREEGPGKAQRSSGQADQLYLATDEDREGEAIAWLLVEVPTSRRYRFAVWFS